MKEVSALALYVPLPKTACGRDLASATTFLYRPFHHKVCTAVLEGCGQGKCPALQLSWHCSRTHGHRAPQRTGLAVPGQMLSTATYIWIIASSHGSHDTHWLGRLDVCLVVHVGPSATVHTAASAFFSCDIGFLQ